MSIAPVPMPAVNSPPCRSRALAAAGLSLALFVSPALAQTGLVATATGGLFRVTLMDAILQGLEHNRSLSVERLVPAIQRTYEKEAEAAFDPSLLAGVSAEKAKTEQPGGGGVSQAENKTLSGNVGVTKLFSTGTRVVLDGRANLVDSSLYADRFDSARAGFSLVQSLLQGGGTAVNLASLRQARLDTAASQYELRGFVETLVAQIESAYWNYALSMMKLDIVSNSLALSEKQLDETLARIAVGKAADVERSAAEAEVATRQDVLITARASAEKMRLQFLRLVNPPGAGLWQRPVELLDLPRVTDGALEPVDAHVRAALQKRSDLNQARLAMERGDLELVKTRNGLLPKLDLFVNLGGTGYANSFGGAVSDLDGRHYDWMAGVALEVPLGNRAARARQERAGNSLEQERGALDNMEQLAELDVRTAYIELQRARDSVSAASVLEKRREESLRAETGKFQAGKSTSLLVSQASRDLLLAQINEVETLVTVLTAFTDLYRLEGTLLERRGLSTEAPRPD